MKIIAVVPVKRLTGVKQRLASRLSPEERAGLVLRCLGRELDLLAGNPAIQQTLVVTPDAAVGALAEMHGAVALLQVDDGLNQAAQLGVAAARERGATHALILHADLPFVAAGDLAALVAAAGRAGMAIAPDRQGAGTNGLLIPVDAGFDMAYGAGSYARHLESARRSGLRVETVRAAGIAFDLDTPADLLEYRRRMRSSDDRMAAHRLERCPWEVGEERGNAG
ncbi:MAG TPA: 2-phospho-L-lactate guanylyltransferase [Thermomicrobiales bacterium]|nr:2-phospho-L-lactate guanylyltransferase [Thermomicrobiales bacterium]